MKKKMFIGALLVAAIAPVAEVSAQYPKVPKEVAEATRVKMDEEYRLSEEAWQRALPIIEQEAREGRPYIPWAARPTDLPQANIPAFPGAEGGGMYSFGGRGGKVITVTNLNDRGPGSFREACETGGARIVVFNVAGIIRLETPIIVRAPYITIAGQTAPGDGVCIAGESFWVNTHDVVVRYMRFRRGETNVGRRDDTFGGNPIGNIMIDHCSTSWGLDENISFYRHMFDPGDGSKELKLPTVNVTIQNTISAQALDTYNHAFGSTLGGENCSFVRNLWASNAGRNPSIGWNGVFNFVNNVIYNWVHRSVDGGDYTALYNIINNYYKPGPLTPTDSPVGHRMVKPESGRSKLPYKVYGRVYCNGNIMEGNDVVTRDNWAGGVQVENLPNTGQYTANMRWNEPFPMPHLTIMTAQEAYNHVLKDVGANIPKRDIVDERIIEEVKTGKPYYIEGLDPESFYQFQHRRLPNDSYKKGIITDIAQVGGYPEYKGEPYVDTDGDGMPDAWEVANKLNPNDPSDANADSTGDGYTNIEKYINAIPAIVAQATGLNADGRDPKYVETIVARSQKIVDALDIADAATATTVRNIIANRYFELNDIYEARDAKTITEKEKDAALYRSHFAFPTTLAIYLTPQQVEGVKDGMTYGVLQLTYNSMLDMIPTLTDEEKARIYAWLVEARELAMDAESANKKHEAFGKYKGRINNYLSARGYNLTKEREEWYKRIEARK